MSPSIVEMFDKMGAAHYDANNANFFPIVENLHFLTGLLLARLPENARVLCVGVGTGIEIVKLGSKYTKWRFSGIEPAAAMLEGARKRVQEAGMDERCELFHGYLSDYHEKGPFDAALCFLVMHFIRDLEARGQMFRQMAEKLKPGGVLVEAEISFDCDSEEFPGMLGHWMTMHRSGGASDEQLLNMKKMMTEQLGVLPPDETKKLIRENGFELPVEVFQSLMIRGWYATRAK